MLTASAYGAVDAQSGWPKRSKIKLAAGIFGLAMVLTVTIVAAVQFSSPNSETSSDSTASVASTTRAVCPLPRGISELTVKNRQVSMYIPDSIASGPLPLIVMFHGISSSPVDVELKARYQQLNAGRFIIAYPYGIGSFKAFNGAGCCDKNGPDDVSFAKEIVLELEALGCAQHYNSFASGFSNGGFMTHRIGCEAGYRADGEPWFRAIAPHSGLLGAYDKDPLVCASTQKIPIMDFHGAADGTVPISGANPNPLSPAVWQSFEATRNTWASRNGCVSPTVIKRAPSTECTQYVCPTGTSVEFCLATGLGHNWMGHQRPTEDYDASTAILHFFASNLKQ